jgi:hypothetical protein
MAWTFISSAVDLCLTLKYHRQRPVPETEKPRQMAQNRLFWTVHRIDKSLSLRLGRPSNIHDEKITIPMTPEDPSPSKLAMIHGRVYSQLYSPLGLAQSDEDRGHLAEDLASEVRELVDHIRAELAVCIYPGPSRKLLTERHRIRQIDRHLRS